MSCWPTSTVLPAVIGNRFKRRRVPMANAPDQYCHCQDCGPEPETTVQPLFERIGDVNQAVNHTLTEADSGKLFLLEGAVAFILPPAAEGLQFSAFQQLNSAWSFADANSAIIARNNPAATMVDFSTANQKIGSCGTMVAVQQSDTTWHWAFFQHCNHTVTVT